MQRIFVVIQVEELLKICFVQKLILRRLLNKKEAAQQ